jgi:hypothetical protein
LYFIVRVIEEYLEKSGENQEDELAEVTVLPSSLELASVHFSDLSPKRLLMEPVCAVIFEAVYFRNHLRKKVDGPLYCPPLVTTFFETLILITA